eukprot:scpid38233/ scgid22098/ Probable G-protein coupled receptor 158
MLRARNSAQADNVFAAGGCIGEGPFNTSQCYYQYRNRQPVPNDRVPGILHYNSLITSPESPVAPRWYSQPKEWLQDPAKHKDDAWLGGRCRHLCPDGSSLRQVSMGRCRIPDYLICPVHTKYSDSLWVNPYFDCELGFTWMVTYSAPVSVYHNNTVHYLGMTGIDVDLDKIPIDQCSVELNGRAEGYGSVFADTNLCDTDTTVCVTSEARNTSQLIAGRYTCVCKEGYYYPHTLGNTNEILGSSLTSLDIIWAQDQCAAEVRKKLHLFRCAKCPHHCKYCISPADDCRYKNKVSITAPAHCVNALALVLVVSLLIYVIRERSEAILRSASWKFLVAILIGCIVAYIGLFIGSTPSRWNCSLFKWLSEIGFALSYGSILLKSWRIEQIFSRKMMSKTRPQSHLRDVNLAAYLVVLVLVWCFILTAATLSKQLASEADEVLMTGKDQPQYFERCEENAFKFVAFAVHLLLLLSSSFLCFKLRRVLNDYAESREISIIVYLSSLVELLAFTGKLFLRATPDIHYAVHSLESLFLFGVMPAILVLPKVRRIRVSKLERGHSSVSSARLKLRRSSSDLRRLRMNTIPLSSFHQGSQHGPRQSSASKQLSPSTSQYSNGRAGYPCPTSDRDKLRASRLSSVRTQSCADSTTKRYSFVTKLHRIVSASASDTKPSNSSIEGLSKSLQSSNISSPNGTDANIDSCSRGYESVSIGLESDD